ncbi:hypothetical protein PAESOLCIP111_04278 [Paenibacillus solanacearum]|uniref:Crp/Fnr family transcriptional regulator n=1 Tax=Paenibacillus solanacearum TaxID=2048548 RepID=A0A916K409_9BACL|nr:Crp/Fnr family transcriptional regulator [Paenibacillus solanacearum]CAG7641865.1 hypothetical protein PAESOLCIP111_04278 [Paenibacillus solanacearum]
MNSDQIHAVIRLFPCFAELSATDWASAETMKLTSSSLHPIAEGHRLNHAPFILSGCVRIFKLNASGREVTLYRVRGGECCVLMMASILGETEYEASVHIESEAEVLLFPVDAFRRWMHSYQPVSRYIYKQFTSRFISVTSLLEQIAFGSMQERVAAYLIQRHQETASSSAGIEMTHEQIAVELGTAREVVSRMLKNLAGEGAIRLQRGKIIVTDYAKLLSFTSLS